jgi:hypothetical protein
MAILMYGARVNLQSRPIWLRIATVIVGGLITLVLMRLLASAPWAAACLSAALVLVLGTVINIFDAQRPSAEASPSSRPDSRPCTGY